MAGLRGYRRPAEGTQPPHLHPPYRSSLKRAPREPLVRMEHTLSEVTGPVFGPEVVEACDLARGPRGEALGERIVVSGRVLDEDGRPARGTLVEVWQANSAGRYRFVTIRPGAYPWRNHPNAWRPAHIHFSVFGPAFATRLVTQMYFPGDPLLAFDPIFNCTADETARVRLVSAFDWDTTTPEHSLGFRFDVVLAGREATPWER